MGYSATKAALDTFTKIMARIPKLPGYQPDLLDGKPVADSWIAPDGEAYFAEIGHQQPDGAVTGSVFVFVERTPDKMGGACRRVATFRIEPDGTLARGPSAFREALK